jgi:hypothetical protein
MDYDMATVTTDVATGLICGETHTREYFVPTQNKIIKNSPTDICHQSVQRKKVFDQCFSRKFHIIFDEDSMIDRQMFAWLLYRLTKERSVLTQAGLDTSYG